jgi:chromate reductase
MRVLGISGSLRRDSHNRRLLLEAAELLPAGTELELYGGLKAIPPYDEDDDGEDEAHEAVRELRDAIDRADAILIATPEYNSSVPGQLKNAIDWASRPRGAAPLLGKPAAVIGTSTGSFGGVWAQAELKKILRTAGARVVEGEIAVPRAHVRLDEDGRLLDDELRERLAALVDALVAETRPQPAPAIRLRAAAAA